MSLSLLLRKTISATLIVLAYSQVLAQSATLPNKDTALAGANSPATTPAATSSPGRLFYSAERRQILDQQRRTLQFQETIVEGDTFTLNGIVTRSSGKWTLWINGSPVTERDGNLVGAQPVAGQAGRGRLSVGEQGAGSSVVAVGDGLERSSGTVSNALGNGTVRVHTRASGR